MTATIARRRMLERMGGRVDSDLGMIYRAKLLGQNSRNGRKYSLAAMQNAVDLSRTKQVYLDHPGPNDTERSLKDWVGVIENPRFESAAIFADIRLRKQSPHFAEIVEMAESFGGFFGMSHVADGTSS